MMKTLISKTYERVTYPFSYKMFLLTCKSFDVLFFSQNAPNSYKIELMEKSKLYLCLTIYLLVKLFFLLFSDVYSVCEDLSSTICISTLW